MLPDKFSKNVVMIVIELVKIFNFTNHVQVNVLKVAVARPAKVLTSITNAFQPLFALAGTKDLHSKPAIRKFDPAPSSWSYGLCTDDRFPFHLNLFIVQLPTAHVRRLHGNVKKQQLPMLNVTQLLPTYEHVVN